MDMNIRMKKSPNGGRFTLSIGGRDAGYVTFVYLDDGTVNIDHTVVHKDFQGRGLAGILVDTVVEMAHGLDKKVVASCSYADNRLRKQGLL